MYRYPSLLHNYIYELKAVNISVVHAKYIAILTLLILDSVQTEKSLGNITVYNIISQCCVFLWKLNGKSAVLNSLYILYIGNSIIILLVDVTR